MTVEGRITVDALFHDKDGTNAINVISLTKADGYSDGIVCVVSGTCNEDGLTFYPSSSGFPYRNAFGNLVVFNSVQRIALVGTDVIAQGVDEIEQISFSVYSNGEIATTRNAYELNSLTVRAANSTSTYTLIVYGS
jgi:hypothetical protein